MVNIASCETDDSKFSTRSLNAIEEIRKVVESSNTLIKITGVIPFFDIFFNKSKPHELVIGVGSYDWDEFTKTMKAIPESTRFRIWTIAIELSIDTYGEEGEFWRCVGEATR